MPPHAFSRACRPLLGRLLPFILILTLLAALGRFVPNVAEALTLTFTPEADAFVDAGSAGSNYGHSIILRTGASPIQNSYLRFTVQGLGGAAITRATLRVYANGSSSVGYSVAAVGDNTWGELTITHNNAPAPGQSLGVSGGHGGAAWTSVDVTSYVQAEGAYSFQMSTTSTRDRSYGSREAGANAPQLVIETGSAASPTAAATVTATASPTATVTHTPTGTPPNTATAGLSPSPTQTSVPSASPTHTRTSTASLPAPSATATRTSTPPFTPTHTATRVPSHPADTNQDGTVDNTELLAFAQQQLARTVAEVNDPSDYPRSNQNGAWVTVSADDWTSGFFPGALWYMYAHTNDPQWRTWAANWTAGIEGQKTRTDTHDVGFQMIHSFVRGYELTGNTTYRAIALQAANSLASRYDPDVRALRSWSFGSWTYPVIIDNMANLELLFWAARNGGGQNLYDLAVNHALTTQREHVRSDGTTFHLVDFNPSTGAVLNKTTHQGYNRDSTWARGQAWGIYGFTLAYRETGRVEFLNTAKRLADYFIANAPADDHIPYWDFEAPDIPNAERDASGAAIAASALYELASFSALSPAEQAHYFAAADAILDGLRGPRYLVNPADNHAVLLHSFGVHPDARQGDAAPGLEVDVPVIYADVFLVEALLRRAGGLPGLPPSATPSPTATTSATRTNTPEGPTPTRTPTRTQTPLAPTPTRTPTPTSTLLAPTLTRTPPPTATGSVVTTLTLSPAADAFVDAARASSNFGRSSILRTYASPEQRSYLRFNVQGLAGRTITRAVLRLYANGSSSAGYRVLGVPSTTWSETGITYNTKPALGALIGSRGAHGGAAYTEVDITSYLTGDGLYSLAITTTSTKAVSYPSREASSNRPELVLTLSGSP